MTDGARLTVFVVVATVVALVAVGFVVIAANRTSARADAPPQVAVTTVDGLGQSPRIVFRNTEVGSKYGLVSMVALSDPRGPRAFTDVACDRVYARPTVATCLRTKRGIVTTFEAAQLDAGWGTTRTWSLPGVPSRTRLSPDGTLLATTSFVTGHSYQQVGFSTATEIRRTTGGSYGNLEKFELIIDGTSVAPADRNIWGVTFGADDDTFYATVDTGGEAQLVRGDLSARTLTSVGPEAECPSLSPDGSQLAFKRNSGGADPHWQIVVLDLATGQETVLSKETRSIDDQVEWLGDTILYGMPRRDEAGVSDIWQIEAAPGAEPSLLIEQAWSPSVVGG